MKYINRAVTYTVQIIEVLLYCVYSALIVTGPAKIGHVVTSYTPSLYRSYLSIRIVYLHSVTCIMMPIKCLLRAENCNAIA